MTHGISGDIRLCDKKNYLRISVSVVLDISDNDDDDDTMHLYSPTIKLFVSVVLDISDNDDDDDTMHLYSPTIKLDSCSKALYSIVIPDSELSQFSTISTPSGSYNACCHYRRKSLLRYLAITSCQVLISG